MAIVTLPYSFDIWKPTSGWIDYTDNGLVCQGFFLLDIQFPPLLALKILNGEYPAIPALQSGVKGYNIKKTPCRKAPHPLSNPPPLRGRGGGFLQPRFNSAKIAPSFSTLREVK